MRSYLTTLLVFVFTLTGLRAQTPHEPSEKALLWEISGKSLVTTSYLFGTIHLIPKSDFFFTEAMEGAFSKTRQVAFEIDMEEMSDLSNMFSMLGKMYMADGKKLRDLLSTEDYEKVKTHFSDMGLPFSFLERVKPMFLSVMTDPEAMTMKTGGADGGMLSYEMELTEKAQTQEKDILGLETMDFQMSLFDSIPYDKQAQILVKAIEAGGGDGESQLDDMVKMYRTQDIQAMYAMMGADEGFGSFDEVLLLRRNRSWIPIMEKLMDEKPTFFAVGAGHLGGPEGVIALLRKSGYTVRAVTE